MSPYSDLFGGAILNATISLYANASIQMLAQPTIILTANDRRESQSFPLSALLPIDGKLDLMKAVCNCIQRDFGPIKSGFHLSTFTDAPAGSGLGSSSTLAVAIVGVFAEMLQLPLGEYDIAHYAYCVEREYLQWVGGKQDQYAATFGGFNFMEFYNNDKVIVNPLRLKKEHLFELENNLLLYYTSISRDSAGIISEQINNVSNNSSQPIEAMHQLKSQAYKMKELLLKGNLDALGEILAYGHQQKIKMATGIWNPLLEKLYEGARNAGATGGKISGAGGGGFMIFYCPGTTKHSVTESLQKFGGHQRSYQFVDQGLTTWSY